MKFVLLKVPSAQEAWADEARSLYQKKISHFHPLEIVALKPSKNSRVQSNQKVREESEKILEFLRSDDFIVVFHQNGKRLDSVGFSKSLERVLQSGKKRCVFLIGGAFGFSEDVKQKADLQVSLSEMVFNHLVAEVVALEQIYRALTISKNIPYHNT